MQSGLYVTLSGQISLERHMQAVANNVANINTAGFRAEGSTFESVLSRTGRVPVAFAGSGKAFLSQQAGPLSQTGNPLDLAVRGDAWFAVQTPTGVRYSRDGRLTMTDMGDIVTVTGHSLLDQGGAPLAVDPLGGEIVVAADGTVSQGGNIVGVVGLFQIAGDADLHRAVDGTVAVSANAVAPAEDFVSVGVVQGYVEGSNVSPVIEMTRLIDVQRRFEQAATAASSMENALNQTIRDLGPTS
ncbi:MAG: flagellar basal-body rod protein FlgF [Pseudochelatococcus sp.]|jgi:flagellar basal-body rod protein FlgF|uniref:flagellar basal-body rod protein FlgF n=1 Tax=Pseudochelatococcus sp. TaxID=2020869 RepID=UPI003D8AB81C